MAKPILIAEDFEHDIVLLSHSLKKAGVANPVNVVHDGEEAISYLKGEGAFADRARFPYPGILFLDLNMVWQGGLEVLEWYKEQPAFVETLIIILSGRRDPKDINRSFELGADCFLVKPCMPQDLETLIKRFPEYWDCPAALEQ